MSSPKQIQRIKLNKKARKLLGKTLIKIKNFDQAENFLMDLLSSAEINDISRRLLAARLLYGNKTYQEINDLLGMGPLTINKVHFKTKGSKILPALLD